MTFRPAGPARRLRFALGIGRFNVFRRLGFEALENRKRPTAGVERALMASTVAVAADVRDPPRIAKASKVPLEGTTHDANACKNQPPRICSSFVMSAPISGNSCVRACARTLKNLPRGPSGRARLPVRRPPCDRVRLPVRRRPVATVVDVVAAAWRRVFRHRIKLRHVECDANARSIVRPALPVMEIDELRQM